MHKLFWHKYDTSLVIIPLTRPQAAPNVTVETLDLQTI